DWRLDLRAGLFVDNAKDLVYALPAGLRPAPSCQCLGDRIHEGYVPLRVGGNDRVADTRERPPQPLALHPHFLLGLQTLEGMAEDSGGTLEDEDVSRPGRVPDHVCPGSWGRAAGASPRPLMRLRARLRMSSRRRAWPGDRRCSD